MELNEHLKLSYYKTVSTINDEHRIYLVQHIQSKKFFVKKIINVYNQNVYEKIYKNPIPGIPKIYDIFEDNNELIVIEEYVAGDTLEEMLENGHIFTDKETALYTYKLCNIVSVLHENNPAIIHRDIKPSNVILTPDGRIMLLDLNAAKYYSNSETEDTVLLGTKGYAAPEQFGFGSSTVQTDIYAIGMLMTALLTGQPAYNGKVKSSLNPVISRCIKINPKERYKSISELKKALSRYICEKGTLYKNNNEPLTARDFILPGFRAGNPFHMAIATVGYMIILYISSQMESVSSPVESIILKLCFLSMALLAVFGSCNYMNIQKLFPPCKSKNKIVRIISIICLDLVLMCIAFFISVLLAAFLC